MTTRWPGGRRFAFTIFDDTDWATVKTVRPVYDLLADLGMRATKSVWLCRGEGSAINEGSTCEDREYLDWVLSLRRRGFEVGLHNVAPSTSRRELVQRNVQRFRDLFGYDQIIHCNHTGCLENIYWGEERLSGWRRPLYGALTRGHRREISRGHLPGDPLFWGDVCAEHVRYVRNFVFDELDTLAVCPHMPYHDPGKPFVNFWFASSNGGNRRVFLQNFTYKRLDDLVAEGGLCIAYVHFGAGFAADGKLHSEFRKRMEYIASHEGWFPPVSEALEYLRKGQSRQERAIPGDALERLERRWLLHKIGAAAVKAVTPRPKPPARLPDHAA